MLPEISGSIEYSKREAFPLIVTEIINPTNLVQAPIIEMVSHVDVGNRLKILPPAFLNLFAPGPYLVSLLTLFALTIKEECRRWLLPRMELLTQAICTSIFYSLCGSSVLLISL